MVFVIYVNEPVLGVELPTGVPFNELMLRPPARLKLVAVKLPTLTLAKPELLIAPVVAPVSVVIKPSNAWSLSRHTQAALTDPYGGVLVKFLLTKIPMS